MKHDELDDWIHRALVADPLPMEVDESPIERGPPFSDAELIAARDSLSKWQTPASFIAATESFCKRFRSEEWFKRPQVKFLHDAYVLAEFARFTKVEGVCLAHRSDQWPDGFVRLGNNVHNIEATSHHGGRKLSDEYGNKADRNPRFIDSAQTRSDLIPRSLEEAISGKIEKNYGSKCWLVVYLNISGFGLDQPEIKKVIVATKERHLQKFEAIAVLWNGNCY
jgi:hypothetical protein